MIVYLLASAPAPSRASRPGRSACYLTAALVLCLMAAAVLAFIYVPLGVVVVNSFSASVSLAWPPPGSPRWWQAAVGNEGSARRDQLGGAGLVATLIALLLGTLTAQALGRYDSSAGRHLLVVLPIALPGIVTGIALNNVFTGTSAAPELDDPGRRPRDLHDRRGLQQLGRTPAAALAHVEEASMDLGATRTRTTGRSPSRCCARHSSPERCSRSG